MTKELDRPVTDFLEKCRVGRLATADREGRPHVIPIVYALVDEAIYFVVDEKPKAPGRRLKRLRNIDENPHVALVVDHYEEEWPRLEYVLVTGRATVVHDASEYDRALGRLRARYPQYRAMRLAAETNPLVRIDAEHVHHWAATAS